MAASAPPDVPPPVRQLAAQLADAKPMRHGSLSERTIKCSKPGCACAKDPKTRHGPYHSLRSEEHTSEPQSPMHLVCSLLLEKKIPQHQKLGKGIGWAGDAGRRAGGMAP